MGLRDLEERISTKLMKTGHRPQHSCVHNLNAARPGSQCGLQLHSIHTCHC